MVRDAPGEFSARLNVEVAQSVYRTDGELEGCPYHMTFQKNYKPVVMIPDSWES